MWIRKRRVYTIRASGMLDLQKKRAYVRKMPRIAVLFVLQKRAQPNSA